MNELDSHDIEVFLTHTDSLLNHVYWVKHDFALKPTKDHLATCINFSDINERRNDFLRELVNTISSWVYNRKIIKKIIDEKLEQTNGDLGNASTFLTTQAFSKFRPGAPQGQFGELLLFNFIQFFFRAVPLLRKQRIITSVGHERFGADAIHFKKEQKNNLFFLGESKCYSSNYKFKKAFEDSLSSIVTTFKNIDKELDLYVYDDFIEPGLEEIAKSYKAGKLSNVHFELVCLIAYNETNEIHGINEKEIKISILDIIKKRCESLENDIFDAVSGGILSRLNYIIFPFWKFDELLDEFQNIVGGKLN